jgi:tetratricopeptide (TPR) repeat protein
VIQAGLRSVSQRSELYAEEGRLRDRMGQYADAESAFQTSLRANPNNQSARQLYARFLLDRGDSGTAEQLLEDGLRLNSDDLRLRHLLAVAMATAGKHSELVIQQFRLAVNSLILHWSAQFDLGVYLYTIGREREAKEVFDELSRIDLDTYEKRRIRVLPAFTKGLDLERVGRIVTLRDWYGFVRIHGHPVDVYLDRYHVSAQLDARLAEGIQIRFRVGFTLSGPTARDVRAESANDETPDRGHHLVTAGGAPPAATAQENSTDKSVTATP